MTTNNSINLSAAGIVAYDGAGTFSGRTLTAGTGITITNGTGVSGNPVISSVGGGLTWNDVTTTSASMAINNGYLADNSGLVTITLPTTAVQFSVVAIVGHGSGGWTLAQNALQQVLFGKASTTAGTGGSISSTNANDAIFLIASVGGSSTIWTVYDSIGNLTVV